MNKLSKLLMVVALSAAMVLPVLAAPSPSANPVAAKEAVVVAVEGAKVEALPAKVFEAVKAIVTNATHLTNLGVKAEAKMAAAFDLSVEIPEGETSVSVPVKVSHAKVGDFAVILHQKADSSWEKVGEGFLGADLTVTGTFTSFSPVVVMVVDAADANAGAKAPKTGEF